MTDVDQLEQNFNVMAERFTDADARILSARLEEIGPYFCRMCGQCEGQCPKGLPVADMVRFVMYADGYGQFPLGREHFQRLSAAASERALRRLCRVRGPLPQRSARGGAVEPGAGAVWLLSRTAGEDRVGAGMASASDERRP